MQLASPLQDLMCVWMMLRLGDNVGSAVEINCLLRLVGIPFMFLDEVSPVLLIRIS